jgi:hypothetical protein
LPALGLGLALFAALPVIGVGLLPSRTLRLRGDVLLPAALALGALAVGLTVFTVGSLLGTRAVLPVLAVLLAFSARRLPRVLGAARSALRHVWLLARASWPVALLLAALLVTLVPSLLAPLADSDGLRYHVALPRLYLLEGRVSFYPYDLAGAYPQCGEMLYLVGLLLGPGETARTVHCLFFMACLATLGLALHRDRRSRLAAIAAPWLLAASPLAIVPAAAGFVDLIAMFHLAAAWLLWRRRAPTWLVGIALAAAATTKISTGPAVVALAVWIMATAGEGRRWRTVAALAVPIAVAWLPFAVRNLVALGDPLYPLWDVALGRPLRGLAPDMQQWVRHFHADVPGFLGIPWGPGLAPTYPDEVVGWHHLAGLLGLTLAAVDRRARACALVIASYAILGFWAEPPTRLLLPALLALAMVEGLALARLPRLLAAALAIGLALPTAIDSARLLNRDRSRWLYLTGRLSREALLKAEVPGYAATRAIAAMEPGGRVMALDFPAPYYFDRPWIAEGFANEPPLRLWLEGGAGAPELLARLRALDVRFLVVTPRYGGGSPHTLLPLLASSPAELATMLRLKSSLTPVWSRDGIDILRVPPDQPGP